MSGGAWDFVDTADPRIRAGLERLAARRRDELAAGARRVGWKVGLNDVKGRAMLSLASGVVGYLTDRTMCTTGEVAIGAEGFVGEIEIAFRLGATLASTASDAEAIAAIDALLPAIEIAAIAEFDVEDMLARDVWHHAYALGPAASWRPGLLESVTVAATHNETALDVAAPAANKLADVASMLRFVASGAEAIGEQLSGGDVILSGSLAAGLTPLTPGDALAATMSELGAVAVSLVAAS